MRFSLVVVQGPDTPLKVDLPASGDLVIGRGTQAGLKINDDQASRLHTRITVYPFGLSVQDLGSTNGTFVNGRRIPGVERLASGDRIQVGNSHFTVVSSDLEGVPCGIDAGAALLCLACGNLGRGPCPRCGPSFLAPPDAIPGVRIERRLGAGNMGVVFLVRQTNLDREAALKVFPFSGDPHPERLQRFLREAKIPAMLDHPNVVRVFNTGVVCASPPPGLLLPGQTPGKAAYILMEYVEGRNLAEIVRAAGPMALKPAVDACLQAARALASAGPMGIVHRDIKPENLVLTLGGEVKVMDFGLAKSYEETGMGKVTQTGTFMGTPSFTSPEQIRDAKRADHRSDIYSLGATLYYLIAGVPPFQGKIHDVLKRVLDQPAPRLETVRPETPPGVCDLVARCLEKDPAKRHARADELVEDLEQILDTMRPMA